MWSGVDDERRPVRAATSVSRGRVAFSRPRCRYNICVGHQSRADRSSACRAPPPSPASNTWRFTRGRTPGSGPISVTSAWSASRRSRVSTFTSGRTQVRGRGDGRWPRPIGTYERWRRKRVVWLWFIRVTIWTGARSAGFGCEGRGGVVWWPWFTSACVRPQCRGGRSSASHAPPPSPASSTSRSTTAPTRASDPTSVTYASRDSRKNQP